MSKILPEDGRDRRIPQSKNEGTFDRDLFDTLKKTIRQANQTEEKVENLDGEGGSAEEFTEAFGRLQSQIDTTRDRVNGFENELDDIDKDFEIPEINGEDLTFDSLSVGEVGDARKGTIRAENGAALGRTDAASHYLDIHSRSKNHVRLSGPNAEAELWAQDNTLGLSSKGIEIGAETVLPKNDYETTLGSPQNKFLSLHAAELWIESLVAQKKTATIGGSVFVGPTTKLTANLSSSEEDADSRPHKDQYNFIRVEHGQLSKGDIIQMEARGRVEFMRVAADRTEIESPEGEDPLEIGTGVYRYEVERDLDGTGPNTWKEGDAVISTGREGSGFIDLYAQRSQKSENESGPSIAISVREEDESTWDGGENQYYNEWAERSAIGNLSGLYDFTGDVYGVAGGRYEDAWFSVDETQGFRLMNQDTLIGQWDTDGTVRVGPYQDSYGAHPSPTRPDGSRPALSPSGNAAMGRAALRGVCRGRLPHRRVFGRTPLAGAWQHGRKGGPGRAAELPQGRLTGPQMRAPLAARAPDSPDRGPPVARRAPPTGRSAPTNGQGGPDRAKGPGRAKEPGRAKGSGRSLADGGQNTGGQNTEWQAGSPSVVLTSTAVFAPTAVFASRGFSASIIASASTVVSCSLEAGTPGRPRSVRWSPPSPFPR